ncbi:MAG: BrnT family toxin [Phormidesmis sp.]
MDLQYDPDKAASNLRKHGVSFPGATGVFSDPLVIHSEDVSAVGEVRFIALGMSLTFKVLTVAYTFRGDDIRLISARRATKPEVKAYEG